MGELLDIYNKQEKEISQLKKRNGELVDEVKKLKRKIADDRHYQMMQTFH